jgi:predicted Zn-dependent protease
MSGLFYHLGKLAGPKLRKAKWAYLAATAPQEEVIAAEVEVGSEMTRQMLKTLQVSPEPAVSETLSRIGEALTNCVKNKSRPFSFYGYVHDQPQAFCLPGGFIFVSDAMIELCERDRQRIAFVLAHEMAHVIEGHVMERMLGNALMKVVSRTGQLRAAAAGAVGRLGLQFLERAYSQENELRADALAARLTAAGGYDPAAGIDLFLALQPLEKTASLGAYFSTHPACRDRIAHLRRLLNTSAP